MWIGVLAAMGLWAADPRLPALLRAQTEFDRVALAAAPRLADTALCVQSQAAWLPVATPEEVPLVHFRKGYCSLIGASMTHDAPAFTAAADQFDKAIDGWPARAARPALAQPAPSVLHVLAVVARLGAGADSRAGESISASLRDPTCPASLLSSSACQVVFDAGREWLGWIALQHEDFQDAARDLAGLNGSGWEAWVAGKRAFQNGAYRSAVREYQRALTEWDEQGQAPGPTLRDRLGPPPDLRQALASLGAAQVLAGDAREAIPTLDRAIQADPSDARVFFLRARARELAGANEQALADYNLASRTAFAVAGGQASGEAHLYRGILLYRRKDFGHAESEFSSALNFGVPDSQRPDAIAWRHLAAVAGGSCEASRVYLEQSLDAVSPYFPRQEARAAMASCFAASHAGGL